MRKCIYLSIILGMIGLMSSCFEDEGNYVYQELPEFYVDTVGKQLYFVLPQFSEITLESNLVYDGDKSGLEFAWSIYENIYMQSDVLADTLAKTENLSTTIEASPGNYIIEFCALERQTGIRATMRYYLTVESVVGTGLIVYYQQNGQADCDMIRSQLFNGGLTESTISKKLYSLANSDIPLTGEPVCIGSVSGTWIYLLTDSELVRLSTEDMTVTGEFEDLFLTVPEVCKPEGYYSLNGLEVLINDKKAYTLLIGMGGLQFPLARTILGDDYEAAPYAFVGWGVSALIYDETQGRFLLGETYSSEWQEIPFTDGCAFDMGNMEKDLVYMAQGYCDQNYAMYGYAVMETPGVPAERAVYVYTTAYNAAGTKGYAILDLAACNDIDEAAYWAFSTRSPSMYYATSTNIYLCNFNLTNWTVVPPTQPAWTCPAGEEITCMRLFSSSGLELKEDASCKYLLVGTYNGVEGKVYILGADVASGIITPEALEVYDGLGKIKDMQFKAQ